MNTHPNNIAQLNHVQYKKDLRFLVEKTHNEHLYWMLSHRKHQHQDMRTLLWTIALLLAFELTFLFFQSHQSITLFYYYFIPTKVSIALIIFSALLLTSCFFLAMWSLNEKSSQLKAYEDDLTEHQKDAYKDACYPDSARYENQVSNIARSIQKNTQIHLINKQMFTVISGLVAFALFYLILALFNMNFPN